MTSVMQAALDYADRGLRVLPIKAGTKLPSCKALAATEGEARWGHLRAEQPSHERIRAWLDADPECGIAIITGTASGIAVADIDRPDRSPTHPATPVVSTGRGRHVYLRLETPFASRKQPPWGEIKADGGYVLAPPSVHPDGTPYEWQVGLDHALAPLASLQVRGAPGEPVHPGTTYQLPRGTSAWSDIDAAGRTQAAGAAFARRLGMRPPRTASKCILPGTNESRPSAALYQDPLTGNWKYRDFHCCHGKEWLSMAELYAAVVSGRLMALNAPSSARWYRRLMAESGLLEAVPVTIAVPPGSTAAVARVAHGLGLLFGVRWLTEPIGSPAPCSRSFGAPWCAVSERTFGPALGRLLDAQSIIAAGRERIGARPARVYLPGPGPW